MYTEAFVSVEEATAYVVHDIDMAQEQAECLVSTLESHPDGRISCVELVQLVGKIKETYAT